MKGIRYVLLNKNGNVTNKKFTMDGELSVLLNKATRIKMSENPIKLYSFNINDDVTLDIWGYINGKSGQENTHDLPPNGKTYLMNSKSDTDLLFGDSFVLKGAALDANLITDSNKPE